MHIRKNTRFCIQSYVRYLEFYWILRSRQIAHFNYLLRLCVCYSLVRVFVLYLLHGCLITNKWTAVEKSLCSLDPVRAQVVYK